MDNELIIDKLKSISLANKKPKSYARKIELPPGVHKFVYSEYDIFAETTTHYRYNCPFCLSERGKEDNDGKFYYDKTKHVGFCFKCLSVGLSADNLTPENIAKAKLRSFNHIKEVSSTNLRFQPIKYLDLFNEVDEEGSDYLSSRFPLYNHLAKFFEFRVSPKVGISVPLYFNNEVISYNLRFYNPSGKMKYFIPQGVKYLYSPNRIFGNKRVCKVTLVEGVYDAIAALMQGYENPVAIFGLYLTDIQKYMLRTVCPTEIDIMLDKTYLSNNLKWKILKSFPTVEKINVIESYGDDPEESMKNKLLYFSNKEDDSELSSYLVSLINNTEKSYEY